MCVCGVYVCVCVCVHQRERESSLFSTLLMKETRGRKIIFKIRSPLAELLCADVRKQVRFHVCPFSDREAECFMYVRSCARQLDRCTPDWVSHIVQYSGTQTQMVSRGTGHEMSPGSQGVRGIIEKLCVWTLSIACH